MPFRIRNEDGSFENINILEDEEDKAIKVMKRNKAERWHPKRTYCRRKDLLIKLGCAHFNKILKIEQYQVKLFTKKN